MKSSYQSGFSLIELMIAVAILAILVSLAAPVMDLVEKRRLTAAAEAVYGQIQLARSEAVKQGTDMHLNYQSDGSATWCLGVNNGADCDCTVVDAAAANYCGIPVDGSATQVLQVVKSTDFANISSATGAPSNVTLNYVRGGATGLGGTEGTFTFTSAKGLEIRVVMNVLGRVRTCSPATAGKTVAGYAPC